MSGKDMLPWIQYVLIESVIVNLFLGSSKLCSSICFMFMILVRPYKTMSSCILLNPHNENLLFDKSDLVQCGLCIIDLISRL